MTKWVITCEHGGNDIPDAYAAYFADAQYDLNSHKGIDLGALDLFNDLTTLADFSIASTTSRLLVELNRSPRHKNLFSSYTRYFDKEKKTAILRQYYLPYREKVEQIIAGFISSSHKVIHISVHSFTSDFNGQPRNADIGLLYDPKRKLEQQFCSGWKEGLKAFYHIRMNYPYLGTADGFTTFLRKRFSENYLGIELEVNQAHQNSNLMNKEMKNLILRSLSQLRQSF